MTKYILPIMIEANSKQEAEQKLVQLLKIAAEHKQVTLNDFLGGFVSACTQVASFLDNYKQEKLALGGYNKPREEDRK